MISRRFLAPPPSDLPVGYTPLEYVSGPIPIPCSLNSNNSVKLDFQLDGVNIGVSTPKHYPFYGSLGLPSGSNWFGGGYVSFIVTTNSATSNVELMLVEPDYSSYTRLFGTSSYAGRHQAYFHPSGGLLDSTIMNSTSSEGFWLGLGYKSPTTSSGATFISVGTFYGVSITNEDEYVFYGIPCSNAEGAEGIYDVIGGAFHATRQVCTITRVSTSFTDTETGNRVYRYRATFPPSVDVTLANSVVYPAGVTEALLSSVTGANRAYTTSPVFDDKYLFVYGGYDPE